MVFPRLIPLSVLVVAVASLPQWIVPLGILSDIAFVDDVDWYWPAGFGLVLGLGGALGYAGHVALARRGPTSKVGGRRRRWWSMACFNGRAIPVMSACCSPWWASRRPFRWTGS